MAGDVAGQGGDNEAVSVSTNRALDSPEGLKSWRIPGLGRSETNSFALPAITEVVVGAVQKTVTTLQANSTVIIFLLVQ